MRHLAIILCLVSASALGQGTGNEWGEVIRPLRGNRHRDLGSSGSIKTTPSMKSSKTGPSMKSSKTNPSMKSSKTGPSMKTTPSMKSSKSGGSSGGSKSSKSQVTGSNCDLSEFEDDPDFVVIKTSFFEFGVAAGTSEEDVEDDTCTDGIELIKMGGEFTPLQCCSEATITNARRRLFEENRRLQTFSEAPSLAPTRLNLTALIQNQYVAERVDCPAGSGESECKQSANIATEAAADDLTDDGVTEITDSPSSKPSALPSGMPFG